MATDYKIKDQKLQYDIEAAKIRDLSYRKIDKYEYLRGEEILLSHQRQMIEQARFKNYSLGKDFEKKKKNQLKSKQENEKMQDGFKHTKKTSATLHNQTCLTPLKPQWKLQTRPVHLW